MNAQVKYYNWITLGLFVALCFAASCSPLQQKGRIPECKVLFEQIKQGCHRDDASGLYRIEVKGGEGTIRDHQECFKGLTRKDMTHLFGKPDTLLRGKMIYFLSEPCIGTAGENANACHFMCCNFDGEGGATKIEFVYVNDDMDMGPSKEDNDEK